MVKAICREMELRKEEINEKVETVYLGGGTPSLLSLDEINQILDKVYSLFNISKDAEVTIEANPDDLTKEKIAELKTTPINRFSIGVQSFFNEDLKLMNRAHNANEAYQSVKDVQDAGFENITIDLIFGSQTTTDEMWQKNLDTAVELNVPHVSAYALTIEPKTLLYHKIHSGKLANVDDEKLERQFRMLLKTLTGNGFVHYETSNFGKPGYFSRHNSSYWEDIPYLGIGPSAHSYDGRNRSWNIENNFKYFNAIEKGELPSEYEELTQDDRFNELIMVKLRTVEGLSLEEVKSKFPTDYYQKLITDLQPYLEDETLEEENEFVKATKKGKFLIDGIAAKLFRI